MLMRKGTGIFNSPGTAMRDTKSAGLTLIFWFAGALYTLAWAALNIELGLSLPRHTLTLPGKSEDEYGVPRSGGILNYVCFGCHLTALTTFSCNTCIPGRITRRIPSCL